VVRQDYCDRISFAETVRQFEFIEAKMLGVVFNCTSDHEGKYGKRYYKHYYKRAGRYYDSRNDRGERGESAASAE
jgi:Mrp family chromosome partitioning ATPase